MENNMTPAPWEVAEREYIIHVPDLDNDVTKTEYTIRAVMEDGQLHDKYPVIGQWISNGSNMVRQYTIALRKEDAEAIVSAVNNTYGKSINPEAVKDLYDCVLYAISALESKGLSAENLYATIEKAKIK